MMAHIEHSNLTSSIIEEARPPELSYPALFVRFLRFGVMAFGGPVAQIAMIRRELVDEERWIPSDRFNKLLA
ncbi:chromate transporter, partial [Escherichia coli]|nr:chromate transporter [Escherichia coli]